MSDTPPPAAGSSGLGQRQVLWLSVVALLVVLAVTYMLVPSNSAPFIYAFF